MHAQSHFMDTIKKALHKKPTSDLRLDGRNSFITGTKTPISGIKAGLDFNSQFAIGIGYQWMGGIQNESFKSAIYLNNDTAFKKIKLRYLSFYAQYVFYKTKHWKFAIMPQIGIGTAFYTYQYKSKTYLNNESMHTPVFIYEPMLYGSYKFFKYLGVGADLGWRFTFKSKRVVSDFLTSPIYSFHLDIYWWTIYKDVFKKK
jgi:hypothetical protein